MEGYGVYSVKSTNSLLILLINCYFTTGILIKFVWNIVKKAQKIFCLPIKNWEKNRETTVSDVFFQLIQKKYLLNDWKIY